MKIFSVPRPNGSQAERLTCQRIQDWLTARYIPYRVHSFRHYPYFFEAIGVWLILSRTLLALAVWLHWGWTSLLIAVLGLVGGTLDVLCNLPIITWPGARRGMNLLIEFDPPQPPQQEILICAHYDTKTELLDHHQRMIFIRNLRFGIFLTLMLGVVAPFEAFLHAVGSPWAAFVYGFGVSLSLPLLLLAWGLGLNLSLGRLAPPSQGAVDNGSACAILLGLAERLRLENPLSKTRVTLALFTGEEVHMQGSRAYVRSRSWPLPALAINLEIMAQNGEYVIWEQDGNAFRLMPTTQILNEILQTTVAEITGHLPSLVGPVNSDGFSFLAAGIPTAVLGTYDRQLEAKGLHRPTDTLNRVVIRRLLEGVEILFRLIQKLDRRWIATEERKLLCVY